MERSLSQEFPMPRPSSISNTVQTGPLRLLELLRLSDRQRSSATTAVGTVTPFGQAAPGIHQVRQSFLTRQGFLTRPSPWAQFIANGGQYLQISNLAIGPSNVVARIIEFTGALGALFYYIPYTP